MADYKQIALKYCREKVLPKGYIISDDLRRKLITLVEDAAVNYNEFATGFDTDSEVLTCIETGDIDEPCLNDMSKKVRETVLRSALSGTEMDRSTRLRLSEIIKEKKLKLTKKQKGRLKNLLEQ